MAYQYTIKEFELLVEQAVKLNMVLDVQTNLREMEYIIEKSRKQLLSFRISENRKLSFGESI